MYTVSLAPSAMMSAAEPVRLRASMPVPVRISVTSPRMVRVCRPDSVMAAIRYLVFVPATPSVAGTVDSTTPSTGAETEGKSALKSVAMRRGSSFTVEGVSAPRMVPLVPTWGGEPPVAT
jgi:hypothetical protein